MNDPLPPRNIQITPTPALATVPVGGAELILQGIGMVLEQSRWLIWIGVALLGAVVGVIYALQHAPAISP